MTLNRSYTKFRIKSFSMINELEILFELEPKLVKLLESFLIDIDIFFGNKNVLYEEMLFRFLRFPLQLS